MCNTRTCSPGTHNTRTRDTVTRNSRTCNLWDTRCQNTQHRTHDAGSRHTRTCHTGTRKAGMCHPGTRDARPCDAGTYNPRVNDAGRAMRAHVTPGHVMVGHAALGDTAPGRAAAGHAALGSAGSSGGNSLVRPLIGHRRILWCLWHDPPSTTTAPSSRCWGHGAATPTPGSGRADGRTDRQIVLWRGRG